MLRVVRLAYEGRERSRLRVGTGRGRQSLLQDLELARLAAA